MRASTAAAALPLFLLFLVLVLVLVVELVVVVRRAHKFFVPAAYSIARSVNTLLTACIPSPLPLLSSTPILYTFG